MADVLRSTRVRRSICYCRHRRSSLGGPTATTWSLRASKKPLSAVESCSNRIQELCEALSNRDVPEVLDFLPACDDDGEAPSSSSRGTSSHFVSGSSISAAFGLQSEGASALVSAAKCFDACAQRMLFYGTPSQSRVLSSMAIGDMTCVQRLFVEGASGEEAILTFQCIKEERLAAIYRGGGIIEEFVVENVTGEPVGEAPEQPDKRNPPEAVVSAQLRALEARDVGRVFAFASPENRAVTGPVDRFATMLSTPPYDVLMGAQELRVVRSAQLSREKFLAVVEARGTRSGDDASTPALNRAFVWSVELQVESGLWLTSGVMPAQPPPPPEGTNIPMFDL